MIDVAVCDDGFGQPAGSAWARPANSWSSSDPLAGAALVSLQGGGADGSNALERGAGEGARRGTPTTENPAAVAVRSESWSRIEAFGVESRDVDRSVAVGGTGVRERAVPIILAGVSTVAICCRFDSVTVSARRSQSSTDLVKMSLVPMIREAGICWNVTLFAPRAAHSRPNCSQVRRVMVGRRKSSRYGQ